MTKRTVAQEWCHVTNMGTTQVLSDVTHMTTTTDLCDMTNITTVIRYHLTRYNYYNHLLFIPQERNHLGLVILEQMLINRIQTSKLITYDPSKRKT